MEKITTEVHEPLKITTGRNCGKCQVCCVAFRIDELKKPSFTRCRNQGNEGCTIYKSRPTPCREFKCMWLQGVGAKDDRPDKTGSMLASRNHDEYGPWVSLHVVDQKALTKRRVKNMLIELIKRTVVIEFMPTKMRLIGGPAERVENFKGVAATEQVPLEMDTSIVPVSALRKRR